MNDRFLIILSAPSGTGKTTVAQALVGGRDDMAFSVSATTRPPRPGEREGVDYYFLTRAEFEKGVADRRFLEWAEYNGHLYGTLSDEVDRVLRSERHAVLDIETQGARRVREQAANVVSIFILPPDGETLIARLEGRGSETRAQRAGRLRQAVQEIAEAVDYDYIVINDELERTVAEVGGIVDTEVRRPNRMPDMEQYLNTLRDALVQHAEQYERKEE